MVMENSLQTCNKRCTRWYFFRAAQGHFTTAPCPITCINQFIGEMWQNVTARAGVETLTCQRSHTALSESIYAVTVGHNPLPVPYYRIVHWHSLAHCHSEGLWLYRCASQIEPCTAAISQVGVDTRCGRVSLYWHGWCYEMLCDLRWFALVVGGVVCQHYIDNGQFLFMGEHPQEVVWLLCRK